MSNDFSASNIMSGESDGKTIYVDMTRCIEQVGPNQSSLDRDKLALVLEDLFNDWHLLRAHVDRLSKNGFAVEESICTVASDDPGVFKGIGEVVLKYNNRTVKLMIRNNVNLLDVINSTKSKGEFVEVLYKPNNVVIMKEWATGDVYSTDRDVNYFLCIDCYCRIEPGVEVPSGIRVETPVTLNSNKLNTSVIFTDVNFLDIRGEVVIEADVPIISDNIEHVVIRGEGTLVLRCSSKMQPCIGTKTSAGMSYGRWSPNGIPPKKIFIDGVNIICESKTDNFALGKYGDEFVPEIVLKNGGTITCPETRGKRIVTKQAKAPDGSTKISEEMQYSILEPNMNEDDMISPRVKAYIEQLPEDMRQYVNYKTQLENIVEAVKLTAMNEELDVSLLLDGVKRVGYARTATLMCNKEIYDDTEFMMEGNKLEYLIANFIDRAAIESEGYDLSAGDLIRCLVIAVRDALGNSVSDYDYEVLYEMIPAYFFNGWIKDNKKETVEGYISEHPNTKKITGKIRQHLKVDKCIRELYM